MILEYFRNSFSRSAYQQNTYLCGGEFYEHITTAEEAGGTARTVRAVTLASILNSPDKRHNWKKLLNTAGDACEFAVHLFVYAYKVQYT